MVRRPTENKRPVFEVHRKENVTNMKNWELRQELGALRSEYGFGKAQLHAFSRTYNGFDEDICLRTSTDIIDHSIKYIEELEVKVEELSYAQKIIDEVRRNERIYK